MHITRLAVAVLLALTVSLRPAAAAPLVVYTNLTETGMQSYSALFVTNGATYTVTGPTANVAITNPASGSTAIGQLNPSGSVGNLVVSNGAVVSLGGSQSYIYSPNATVTSTVSVVGSTLNSGYLQIGYVPGDPGQLLVTAGSTITFGGLTMDDGYMLIAGGSHAVATNQFVRLAADYAGESARLDVTGAGTTLWVSNSVLNVGRSGLGILNISSGAVVTTSVALGTYSGIGDGSSVSGNNTGIVTVASGGQWINGGSFDLGVNSVGLMTVQGTNSYVSGYSMSIAAPTGYNSSLVISNGAYVNLGGVLSVGNGGSVLVTNGGILQVSGTWSTGGSGTISNIGGVYQFNYIGGNTFTAIPGSLVLSNGTISFFGRNDVDVFAPKLTNITFQGQNTFMLNSATNLTSGQTYTFNALAGNPSNFVNLAMVNGTTEYRGGNLTIGGAGSMLISNTTATITGLFTNQGVLTLATATANFANGVINSGTLRGNGTIIGNVTSSGTNSPGFSVGTLAITGNLSLTNGAVTWMELAAPGSNDLIAVTGQFSFGGELTVTNSTGFTFAAGQSFQLFSFGSQTNNFGVTNLPVLVDNSLGWNTSQLNSQGILSIMTVPEPSALLLVGLGLLGLFWSRRRTPSRSQR